MKWIITYWIATTIYGVYWAVKNPPIKHGKPDEKFTLLEALAYVFPAGLIAWAAIPMMLLNKIEFKR